MNRRGFFRQLASGLVVAAAPSLFIPKLTTPRWPKPEPVIVTLNNNAYYFKGVRYPVYFSRILSPVFLKDIDRLKAYDPDIRDILLEREHETQDQAAMPTVWRLHTDRMGRPRPQRCT